MTPTEQDIYWMNQAYEKALAAEDLDEVPVGAVLIHEDTYLAGSGNRMIIDMDPTAHAEIVTLRQASLQLANYRLPRATLYVTLEPCIMCAGALLHARVQRIVFGATDPKTGALVSQYHIGTDGKLNHRFEITQGIEGEKCSQLLKDFFAKRRKRRV